MTRPVCLIVDDSLVTRLVGRQIAESLGFTCIEAADGTQAVTACNQNMPQVILLDWNMPHLSGFESMLQIRQLPHGKTPIIIFCTAEHDAAKMADALNSGANEYIIKPFNADVVRDKFIMTGAIHG